MNQKVIFIFDYYNGLVYKHYLTTEESKIESDVVFDKLCTLHNIFPQDAYYMSTNEDDIITI